MYGLNILHYSCIRRIRFLMSKFQRIISICLIPAMILFMVYLPKYAESELKRDYYHEWLEPKKEEYSGIINVWHVVGFRPYLGSLGNWLKDVARKVEKAYFGVYFNVEAITSDEAEERILRGENPDVLSFPALWYSEEGLQNIEDDAAESFAGFVDISGGIVNSTCFAIPYAASSRFVLYDPSAVSAAEIEEDLNAVKNNSLEDFKAGKVSCCIADARETGDLSRALLAGKAEYFEIMAFENETELVQYLGITLNCEEAKVPYIYAFFEESLKEKAQLNLCDLGLMPLNPNAQAQFEQPYLNEAYELISKNESGIRGAFEQ